MLPQEPRQWVQPDRTPAPEGSSSTAQAKPGIYEELSQGTEFLSLPINWSTFGEGKLDFYIGFLDKSTGEWAFDFAPIKVP
jgi:hypothetical protein